MINNENNNLVLKLYKIGLECQDGDFQEELCENASVILEYAKIYVDQINNVNSNDTVKLQFAIVNTQTGIITLFRNKEERDAYLKFDPNGEKCLEAVEIS